jgi:hypothetical protein
VVQSLLLLRPGGRTLVADVVPGRVALEQLRPKLRVERDESRGNAIRSHVSLSSGQSSLSLQLRLWLTYPLRVHLADVGQPLRQCVCGHLVAVLVPELGGLSLGTLRKRPGIGDGSRDDAADRR